jgi:endonuclease YncB( thermonuclease family)
MAKWVVIRVNDGDTFQVHHEGVFQKIRLIGIDAPELDQPGGVEAKQGLIRLTRSPVEIDNLGRDRWGRVLAEVWCTGEFGDRLLVNREMVLAGLAWWNSVSNCPSSSTLEDAQRMAKERRIGLWKEANPIPPWKWRNI